MLTGIWKFDGPAATAGKDDLKEMENLRYEFKSNSRVRIYGRYGRRIQWVEHTYVYSPQKQMLIIDNPKEIRDITQFELLARDANTFGINSIVRGGKYTEPTPISVSQAISFVRTGETLAFEKDIESGAQLSGEPLENLRPAMTSTEKLIGTWSFVALEDDGHLSFFAAGVDYPAMQIRLDADGTGSILTQEQSSIGEVSFQFIVSQTSRRVFLYAKGRAVFAVLTVSDFDDEKMTIGAFDPLYLKTTRQESVSSSLGFNDRFPMRFVRISDSEALDKRGLFRKTGIATDYRFGVSLDEIKPLDISIQTVEPSPLITLKFDRARPHCTILSDGSLKIEDQRTHKVTEDGIQYDITDQILLRMSGQGRYSSRTGGYEYPGSLEVGKSIRQLDRDGNPISAVPQADIFVSRGDISGCRVRKNVGKFSRLQISIECDKQFEVRTSRDFSIKSVKVETTCELKR